jgi:hypothetical protein
MKTRALITRCSSAKMTGEDANGAPLLAEGPVRWRTTMELTFECGSDQIEDVHRLLLARVVDVDIAKP